MNFLFNYYILLIESKKPPKTKNDEYDEDDEDGDDGYTKSVKFTTDKCYIKLREYKQCKKCTDNKIKVNKLSLVIQTTM